MKITRPFTTAIVVSTLSAFAFATAERTGAQTLDSYGVLAGSTVTNTGPSVINGDVGASPGDGTPPSVIGFPPGIVNAPFTIHDADADAALAQSAALTIAGGEYAIHGTNAPNSIGRFVSYGCIRMHNKDIIDLYKRVRRGIRLW